MLPDQRQQPRLRYTLIDSDRKGLARKQITHPGITPRPFMRPAFDATYQQSINSMAEYIRTRLPKEIKKAGL